jgi:YqjK-like protein
MMLGPAEARVRQRQLELRLRSAELRAALHQDARALRTPLRWADRGLQVWDWLRAVPWVGRLSMSAAALLLLRRRPGRLLRLAAQSLSWWRLGRRLAALWRQPPAGKA